MSDEAHISAEQTRARTASRISGPQGNCRRPQRIAGTPRQGSQEALSLTAERALRVTTLSKRRDFLAANRGKRAAMPGFVLLQRDRKDDDSSVRLGITVTKKIGNAVVRNRMKRRFRALGREILPASGKAGMDLVLIGRKGGVERDYDALRREFSKALDKLRR
jgi:ribonuclease P protein component